ncbi:hypothetical protein BJ878DRAFT_298508 [Calycina marina]|uniref:U3 small nucleolar RNA-associated protein 10 n=1 Tax=Calycina marina TaxID=1763456 RepID=A0A9P7Z6M3_9HELO|nr:hypothetical protein BJ878DRAFT_298508 [Calycina marina]
MATSIASQLAQVAAKSNNALNLKAQKVAHSKSLIFEPRVAASQSLETIYTLCCEGFRELCLLDQRFVGFQGSLFSPQSQEHDRSVMTTDENSSLDTQLEDFLGLVGARLRLSPAIKSVEWLVRRYRVHEYNTSFLLTTFLPYHTLPIFTTILSILPSDIPDHYNRFLHGHIRALKPPTRNDVIRAASTNPEFTSTLNTYVLRICEKKQHYSALLAFWAGIMTETTNSMLDKARSGRRGVQQQNEQDVLVKLIPTLNVGLSMKRVPELRVGCYMLLTIVASKGGLDDNLLSSMMEAVVVGWTSETIRPALVCLSALAQHSATKRLPRKVAKALFKAQDLSQLLVELSKERRMDRLASGLCITLLHRFFSSESLARLTTVVQILQHQLVTDSQIAAITTALLDVVKEIDDKNDPQSDLRTGLTSALVTFTQQSTHVGAVVQKTLEGREIDIDNLEMKLHTSILPRKPQFKLEEGTKPTTAPVESPKTFAQLFKKVPTKTTTETTFLSHSISHIYTDLCLVFVAAAANKSDLDEFDKAPILRRQTALEDTLYLSFYMKTWCGPHPVLARVSALQMATRLFSETKDMTQDFQSVVPYALTALSDPAAKVRRAAAELFVELEGTYPAKIKKSDGALKRWGANKLFGLTSDVEEIRSDVVVRFIREVLLLHLEECVLDAKHLENLFRSEIGGSKTSELSPAEEKKRLPQTRRISLMSYLASHTKITPLFSVKLRLLRALNQVKGLPGTSRTKVLLPVLQQWVYLNLNQVQQHCQEEQIDQEAFDQQALDIVVAKDEDGLKYLTTILRGKVASDRPQLVMAVFQRLRVLWPSLVSASRLKLAQVLLDGSQASLGNPLYNSVVSDASSGLLQSLSLSTDVLASFLEQLPTAEQLADSPPATKRRRTSHGEVARAPIQDSKALTAAIKKVTFVLQLVDSSDPGKHPELLKPLFNTLAELQHLKAQMSSELAYLQRLALQSLLSILKAYESNNGLKLDRSAVRADLLVDCVQKTGSPQVQNDALLLIASLAGTAPELVLHSVMPIFTFMGSSVLRQNDEYSAHVIDQTVREVIPPLIASLRKEKGNIVTGASELLLSFVAAYEHVPPHRRGGLLVSLVETLGPEDFLYALLAMLVDKYGLNDSIRRFAVELSASFSVEVQLQSVLKYLDLVADLLKTKPTYSAILLRANDESARDQYTSALTQLELFPSILSQRRLVSQTGNLLKCDDMDAARIRELYSTLMENLLILADTVKEHSQLQGACGDILESLLGLLSTSEFVKSVEGLLDRQNDSLRRKILRSLQFRIDKESSSDVSSRISMLGLLPQLTAIIRESKDAEYKHTAVACVDKISEKYGKKDIDAVTAAAETIASKDCLGQSDARLRVMALLCLASLVDILREGIVSVLPIAIPKALDYMEKSAVDDNDATDLHNAGYAFISALVQYLPYMVSGNYLDRLLIISTSSAAANLDKDADKSRSHCLQLAAQKVDAKNLFTALEKNWERASTSGPEALTEFFHILSTAIEKHPKSVVTKYSDILSKIFLNAFDLRRQSSLNSGDTLDPDGMDQIEAMVNVVAIKMIYKFNDSTFRPIFSSLLEWGASLTNKSEREMRLQSIYGFMAVFFEDLKSIVTSYATYLLDNSVEVLKTVDPKDKVSVELWTRVLRTLVKCFEHDQDDFWQAPSHYSMIAPVLCEQFNNAASLPLVQELVPAIVELGSAADSNNHHKELISTILKHLRSESPSVRLAAIQCQHALLDRIGEEWLSMLPEMLPFISELQEDDDDVVERETQKWIVKIEDTLGQSLEEMLN